jgi:hypothetical protein
MPVEYGRKREKEYFSAYEYCSDCVLMRIANCLKYQGIYKQAFLALICQLETVKKNIDYFVLVLLYF